MLPFSFNKLASMEQQKIESRREDVTMPQDIEKRFQHLVNEWFSFQKRAGFLGSDKETLFSNLSQPSENSSKPQSDDNEIPSKPRSSSSPPTLESLDRKKLVLDGCEQNTWNDLCNMLSSANVSPRNQKQQENAVVCLINKEEQLRLTEKTLLEEKLKLVEAQSSLLKYEDSLSKREKLVQQQQQEKAVLDSKLKALETGKAVLTKFYAALKDVLSQLEHRAQVLQDAQLESDEHSQIVAEGNEHFLSYELESFLASDEATEFNNLSLLVTGFDAENWCVIVSAICQRFMSFLARETHLKEWASMLKKEAAKLMKLEQEVNDAKETFASLLKNLEDEKTDVTKEREHLAVWERQLDDCKKAVAESEKEVAVSLAEIQKRAAELAVEESLIQDKKQQLDALEKQSKKTLHDLQLETENLSKQKLLIQEQESAFLAKEKAVEKQRIQVKDEIDKLKEEREKLKGERMADSKEKEATKELQERLAAKEDMLKGIEKELEGKCLAVESLARKLNAREKLLKNIQKQSEEERTQLNDVLAKLDGERRSLEEAKAELESSRKSVEAARESLSKDIKSADERMKGWEIRLKQQEGEALHKQEFLEGLESQVKNEQQRCHMLHTKVQKEQEKMAEDLTEQESNLRKRESILERKEEEIRKSLQKLTDKRNLVDMKLKQLKEIEARTESLEEELHKRHQEHLLKVELHSKDYQNQVEHFDTVRHDLQQKNADIDRRFQEVRALKKEVKQWQKEAEKDLNDKIEELLKEKNGVDLQKQNLKNLHYEVEKAGTKVIDHMVNLDQVSKKLDTLRGKLDVSQEKLQMTANHISKQHKLLKEREINLGVKEQHLETLQNDWERRVKELTSKETSIRLREEALKSKENDSNRESASEAKLLRDNKRNCDSTLKIHYKITEEKLEVSKNMQLPSSPPKEQVSSSSTQVETQTGEASKAEEQAAMLNLEMLQQEFSRILKERESLKAQQHELEETKNEVQDAKMTLAAQLRATKEMVVEASITAQKASREREALERERRLLGKAQKEIEAALSAREAKLSMDEKKLENDKQFLEEEKKRALGIIYKAGQMRQLVDNAETAKKLDQPGPAHGKTVLGRAPNLSFSNQVHQDTQVHQDSYMTGVAHPNPRFDLNMINLWRENECAKIEREEKMIMNEISRLHCQNQDDIKQSGLQQLSNDLEMTRFPSAGGVASNSYQLFQQDLGPSLEALQLPMQGSCDMHPHDIYQPVLDEPSDGFFSGSETAFSRDGKRHFEEADRMQGNYDAYFQDVLPSQNRLENVMQTLVNARQASRSRLHRTKTLLQSMPLTGGLVVTEVQQALCALTERLNLMEQMEDELADELREAYGAALPDSEGIIVDKVELLCKMEEQQTLRAEWEEDMQCQLEKISILQANSQASSCFSTPIKRTVFDRIVSPPSTNQSTR